MQHVSQILNTVQCVCVRGCIKAGEVLPLLLWWCYALYLSHHVLQAYNTTKIGITHSTHTAHIFFPKLLSHCDGLYQSSPLHPVQLASLVRVMTWVMCLQDPDWRHYRRSYQSTRIPSCSYNTFVIACCCTKIVMLNSCFSLLHTIWLVLYKLNMRA